MYEFRPGYFFTIGELPSLNLYRSVLCRPIGCAADGTSA